MNSSGPGRTIPIVHRRPHDSNRPAHVKSRKCAQSGDFACLCPGIQRQYEPRSTYSTVRRHTGMLRRPGVAAGLALLIGCSSLPQASEPSEIPVYQREPDIPPECRIRAPIELSLGGLPSAELLKSESSVPDPRGILRDLAKSLVVSLGTNALLIESYSFSSFAEPTVTVILSGHALSCDLPPNKALQPTPNRSVQSIHGTIWRRALPSQS